MLRYKTKTRPGSVALYDIRPENGVGPFLQPRSPHGGGEPLMSVMRGQCDARPTVTFPAAQWLVPNYTAW